MAAMLDLTKIKKSYLPVRLPDGSLINVGTPRKDMYDELTQLSPVLSSLSDDNPNDVNDALDILFHFTATIMSNNKEAITFSEDYVRDNLEMDGALAFVYAYTAFIDEKKKVEAKN